MGTIFLVYIYIRDSQLNRPESVSLASLARQLYIRLITRVSVEYDEVFHELRQYSHEPKASGNTKYEWNVSIFHNDKV